MFGAVPICYVCGVLADKDYEKEIEILFGRASNVFTVTPPSPRAMKSTDLKAAIKKRFSQLKVISFDSEDGIEKQWKRLYHRIIQWLCAEPLQFLQG